MHALLLMLILRLADTGSGLAHTGDASHLCSMIPLPTARDASLTHILGIATPDTLHAGNGSVKPSGGPGHWGAGRPRPIYGQVVSVQRFGGADSALIARAFEARNSREVVLVPWDYDPACRPTPWSRSARWSPAGLEGAYTVTPRAVEHWADGRPTFDVFAADLEPYPHGVVFQSGYRGTDRLRSEPSLTAEEFFGLYRALPTYEEARRNPAAVEEAISRWESQNPGLRKTYPAPEILQYVRWMAQRSR